MLPICKGKDNSPILSGSNTCNKKQELLNSFSNYGQWGKEKYSQMNKKPGREEPTGHLAREVSPTPTGIL